MKLTGGGGETRPAPKFRDTPKPKKKPSLLAQHYELVKHEAARRQATLADKGSGDSLHPTAGDDPSPLHDIGALFRVPEHRSVRPAKFFGTARPAPRGALEGVDNSVIPADEQLRFAAGLNASAQAQDRRDLEYGAKFGVKVAPTATAKFHQKLKTDPSFQHLVNDPNPDKQFSNVAMASAFGLPVGGQAADRYINQAIDIVKSGFNPKDVPGLVLGPENANSIATLQAAVIAQGFSKEEVDKMNPGQLFAAAGKKNKYTNWWHHVGGRALPTILTSLPSSIGEGILGGPAEAINLASASAHDVKAAPLNIARGTSDPGYEPYKTDDVTREIGSGIKDFLLKLKNHPYESATTDPYNTFLAAWSITHGGTGIAGKALTAGRHPILSRYRAPVEPPVARNTGDFTVPAEVDVPPGPIIPPGDSPIPPGPNFTPPRGIDPAPGGPTVGTPRPSPDLARAFGILDRVDPEATRSAALRAREQKALEDEAANRPQIEDRPAKEAQLKRLTAARADWQKRFNDAKKTRNELRDSRVKFMQGLTEHVETLRKQLNDAPETEKPALRQQLDAFNSHMKTIQEENHTRGYANRGVHVKNLKDIRSVIDGLDEQILQHHIDLNIPHPKAGAQIIKARTRLKNAIRAGLPEQDIIRLRERVTSLENLGREDPLEPFNAATRDMTPEWFDSEGEPLTPVQHALSAFEAKYEAEHSGHTPESDAHAEALIEALHELAIPDNSPELPMLHPLTDHIAEVYHRHFGEDANVLDDSPDPKKLQAFLQDAQRETIAYEKYHNERRLVDEGVQSGVVDDSFRDRAIEQSNQNAHANLMSELEGASGTTVDEAVQNALPPRSVQEGNVSHVRFGDDSALHSPGAEVAPIDILRDPTGHGHRELISTMQVAGDELISTQNFINTLRTHPDADTLPMRKAIKEAEDQADELRAGIARVDEALRQLPDAEVVSPDFPRPGTSLERITSNEETHRPGTDIVPYRDRTPVRRRDVSQEPPPMGAYANVDDGRGLPRGPGTDLVAPERYTVEHLMDRSDPLRVDRGRYSTNLIDRMFEWASDKTLNSESPVFRKRQEKFLARNVEVDTAHVRRASYIKRDELKPLVKAAEANTTAELTALVQAHAQGILPSQMLRVFERLKVLSDNKARKLNFPSELKKILKNRTPSQRDLRKTLDILRSDPAYKAQADWLESYMRKAKDQDFHDDHLFGDIITSTWRSSHDLEKQIKLWKFIVDDIGDTITPEMEATLGEMRKFSGKIDDVLAENGILPRDVMDRRRYQRQQVVSSILGEEIPIDPHAIYVPDRSTATQPGDFLFRRSLKYDKDAVFGGRLQRNKGRLLEEGRLNPAFSSYYTGLTSAMAKVDAIDLQKDLLKKYAHPLSAEQQTFDGERFLLLDATKGAFIKQIQTRSVLDAMNHSLDPNSVTHPEGIQRVLWRDERNPNAILSDTEKMAAARGDMFLVPRAVKNEMVRSAERVQAKTPALRVIQRATQEWREVALKWRPAYFIVNSVDSGARTMIFGGVSPLMLYRTAKMGETRGTMVPGHIKRASYSSYVGNRQHFGSKDPKLFSNKRQQLHDLNARAMRAPVFGPVLATGKFILGGYGDKVLSGTARVENYLRESHIVGSQLKAARRWQYPNIADPRRYFKGIDDHMQTLMEKIKNGEDPSKGNEMKEIVDRTAQILGDFSTAERAGLQIAFPFYRWMAFITKFVLWETPVHYPGRTLLMQQIGQVGWNNLQQMGLLPQNIQGAYPVTDTEDKHVKETNTEDKILRVMYTQAWNGPSTVLNLFGVNAATGELNPFTGGFKSMNPFVQAAIGGLSLTDLGTSRTLQDRNKVPLRHNLSNMGRIFVSDTVKSFWPLMMNYDFSENADNSIPLFDEIHRAPGQFTQPQSSGIEKTVAIITGMRRRPVDLTKMQNKNMQDAMAAVKSMYDSLGDGSGTPNETQTKFYNGFLQEFKEQNEYVQEWMKRYGVDPTTVK